MSSDAELENYKSMPWATFSVKSGMCVYSIITNGIKLHF